MLGLGFGVGLELGFGFIRKRFHIKQMKPHMIAAL